MTLPNTPGGREFLIYQEDDAAFVLPAASSGQPVLAAAGGIYRSSLPTYTNGDAVIFHFDANGRLMVDTEMTLDGNVIVDNLTVWATDVTDSSTSGFALIDADGRPQVNIDQLGGENVGDHGTAVIDHGLQPLLEGKDFDGAALPNTVTEGQAIRAAGTLSGVPYAFLANATGADTPIVADNTEITGANGGSVGLMVAAQARETQKAATTEDYATRLVTNLNSELVTAGYVWTTNSNQVTEVNPITDHYTNNSLADTTDISDTIYCPSSTGASMDGYRDLSLSGKLIDADGTLTLTVEAMNDEDTASGDWIDVTRGGYRPDNHTAGNANISVTNGTETFSIMFDNFNYRYYRVKVTQTGNTNTVVVKGRRKGV